MADRRSDIAGGHHVPIADYAQFWPRYLREHQSPVCRRLHYLGTSTASLALLAALVTGHWWLLAAGILSGYFCAWLGHFFIEKNTPMTFNHPFWSFISDFRMTWRWLTLRIDDDLKEAGVHGNTSPR